VLFDVCSAACFIFLSLYNNALYSILALSANRS